MRLSGVGQLLSNQQPDQQPDQQPGKQSNQQPGQQVGQQLSQQISGALLQPPEQQSPLSAKPRRLKFEAGASNEDEQQHQQQRTLQQGVPRVQAPADHVVIKPPSKPHQVASANNGAAGMGSQLGPRGTPKTRVSAGLQANML